MIEYRKLVAGNTRRSGDEVRHIDRNPQCIMTTNRKMKPGPWERVQLIGHKILASDLMTAEFRREIAVD